jgi:CHAT domain-containing protein/tetratricopeptide (TPR) repeat protein
MTKPFALLLVSVLGMAVPAGAAGQTADAEKECRAAHNKGRALQDQGLYREALPYFQKALELAPAAFGKDHLITAAIQNDLGCLHANLGQYAKAEPLLQRCLQIREARLGKDHPAVADALNNLALVYMDLGQFAQAEPLYQRSLQICETQLGKQHLNVAAALNNLAMLYSAMGQYARAESVFQRSLEIREAKLGKDDPTVADVLNNLGYLNYDMGQYARAEALYQRCLQIRETRLGKDNAAVAQTLNNLAILYKSRRDFQKAEPLFQRSLEIREARFGKDHPYVAASLNGLANLYADMHQYAKAEPLYERSRQITEASLGSDHPEVAQVLNNLAIVYVETGQYGKAGLFTLRTLQIREQKLGEDHPRVAESLNNMVVLYAATGSWDAAATDMDRQRRIEARHIGRILPVLGASGQLQFLATLETCRANALSLALLRRDDPAMSRRSAAWLLNAKGVAQQALTERALLERDATDPARNAIVRQLTALRQQQAALALAVPRTGQEAERFRQLQDLAERQQRLEQQLVQSGGTPRPKEWVEPDQVRAALPADAVFIDIARFKVANFKAKNGERYWNPPHYAAWLVPAGQGAVKLIDLGDAAKIDAAVAAVRIGLLAAQGTATQKSVLVEKGEADAEKELQPALAALAKLVLEPLREHIDSRQQWLISPDGALWLVPWEALPLDDKTYVIEKHTLRYLVSGRDLVMSPFQGKIKRDASVIMADPDFDIDPKEAVALTAKLLGSQRPTTDGLVTALDNPSSTRSASAMGRAPRLPGTAVEAVAIKPKLQAYAGEEPWVYRGKNALEGVFKAFHSPKVVVLSTHGFFLEDQQLKSPDRAALDGNKQPVLTKEGKLPENPLLRCGLLLAGCNQAAAAKPGQEDGVLTGLEIVGCDLRGTELVVLSACETGLGQVRNGEGVAGLRQAFQLAGAQTVVASLWQVSDRDTALLMTDFFDGLAKGKSKAEALREAQLARIKAHRDRDGAAHPFFWAAFTVTGK